GALGVLRRVNLPRVRRFASDRGSRRRGRRRAPRAREGSSAAPRRASPSSLVSRDIERPGASAADSRAALRGSASPRPRSATYRHRDSQRARRDTSPRAAPAGSPPRHRSPGAPQLLDLERRAHYNASSGWRWVFSSEHGARPTTSAATFLPAAPSPATPSGLGQFSRAGVRRDIRPLSVGWVNSREHTRVNSRERLSRRSP